VVLVNEIRGERVALTCIEARCLRKGDRNFYWSAPAKLGLAHLLKLLTLAVSNSVRNFASSNLPSSLSMHKEQRMGPLKIPMTSSKSVMSCHVPMLDPATLPCPRLCTANHRLSLNPQWILISPFTATVMEAANSRRHLAQRPPAVACLVRMLEGKLPCAVPFIC
jgi:hypothetical protein